MIMSDKKFLGYVGCSAGYFLFSVLYLFFTNQTTALHTEWFSDKFFVFQYSLVFLIGCALISRYFNSFSYCRYGTRKKIILTQLILYAVLTVLLVTLLFFFSIMCALFLDGSKSIAVLQEFLNLYFKFLFGSYLLGCLSMMLEYSAVKIFKLGAQVIAFLILAIELLFFVPQIHKFCGNNVNFLFSWVFFEGRISYIFLLAASALLTALVFWIGSRSDLSI